MTPLKPGVGGVAIDKRIILWYYGSMITKTNIDKVTLSVRLPGFIYEILRKEAFDKRISQNDLIIAALNGYLGVAVLEEKTNESK